MAESLGPQSEDEGDECVGCDGTEAACGSDADTQVPDDEPSGASALRTLCPKRHDLLRFEVPWDGDFACDVCLREISRGGVMWSCRCCSYDVCDSCPCDGLPCRGGGASRSTAPSTLPPSTASGTVRAKRAPIRDPFKQAQRAARRGPRRRWCHSYRFDARPCSFDLKPEVQASEADLAPEHLIQLVDAIRDELSVTPARPTRSRRLPEEQPAPGAKFDVAAAAAAAVTPPGGCAAVLKPSPRPEMKALFTKASLLRDSAEYAASLRRLHQDPLPRGVGLAA